MSLQHSDADGIYRHFIEAFIATLAVAGCKVVDTSGREHHERFGQAMARLRVLRDQGTPGAAEFPLLYPTQVTGSYRDIEAGLLMGHGFTVQDPPFFRSVGIVVPPEQARRCLDDIWEVPKEQQVVLLQMAEAFMAPL